MFRGARKLLTKSHRICSIAIVELGLIASSSIVKNPVSIVIILAATAVGASLPDIDEYNSTVSRKSIINFSLFLKHRGITHSLLGWLIFSGGLYYLMSLLLPVNVNFKEIPDCWSSLWLGLVIGYLLHLIEDSFSQKGVQWFAPFSGKKKHHVISYRAGGFFEKMLAFIALVSVIVMTCYWIWVSLPSI